MRRVAFSALLLSAVLTADAFGNNARVGWIIGQQLTTIGGNVNRVVGDVARAVGRMV